MISIRFALFGLLLASAYLSESYAQSTKPNVLFIFTDDQRADTIGARGNELIKTPVIDELVQGGTYFENAYCMGSIHGAVCVPSRAMMMTGRSLYHVTMKLNENEMTMPQWLGQNGYTTFGTGKWHNGKESFARSFQHGTQVMIGGMSDHLKVPIMDLKSDGSFTEKKIGEKFSSTLFADAAVNFLEQYDNSESPFFCYVSFSAPHDPRMSPEEFADMYYENRPPLPANFLPQHPFDNGQLVIRDEVLAAWPRTEDVVRDQLAEYYSMITHMDYEIGRILKTIDDRGFAENTIVVYAADHGLAMGSHGLLGKQSLYEHSMKTPVFINGPGVPAGETRDGFAYLIDLFPTVCNLVGIEPPESCEGQSLVPIINGESDSVRDTVYTTYAKTIRAVRDDRWKLIRYPQIDRTQLFDLVNDPDEMNDLAAEPEHAQRIEEMKNLLLKWQAELDDVQPWVVDNPKSGEVDLSNVKRKPDGHQPKWIVEKYFDVDADK